jgi:hypothetical protein
MNKELEIGSKHRYLQTPDPLVTNRSTLFCISWILELIEALKNWGSSGVMICLGQNVCAFVPCEILCQVSICSEFHDGPRGRTPVVTDNVKVKNLVEEIWRPLYSKCRNWNRKLAHPRRTLEASSKRPWWCKIWGFHGGDYEEWRLLGCYAVWLL